MPRIIVQIAGGERDGAATLQERLSCRDLGSDHFAGQLVERIGWALLDAEDVEAETAEAKPSEAVESTRFDRRPVNRSAPAGP